MEHYNLLVIDATLRVHEALKTFQKKVKPKSWKKDLCGACAVGSVMLKEELAYLGLTAHVIITHEMTVPNFGWNLGTHCFCIVMNEKEEVVLILDPTFSQINPEMDVLVIDREHPEFNSYFRAAGEFTVADKFGFRDWNPTQRPAPLLPLVKKYLSR